VSNERRRSELTSF